jgi:hypothetical protein
VSRIRRLEYFKKVILSAVLFFILFLPLGWAEEEESKSELKFIQFHSIY